MNKPPEIEGGRSIHSSLEKKFQWNSHVPMANMH